MDELLDDETAARSLQVPVKLQTALRRSKLQGGTKFEVIKIFDWLILSTKVFHIQTEAVHENAENTDNNHYHKIFAEMSRLMKSAGANSEVLPQNIEDFQLYSSTMVDVSPMKDLGIMKKILRSGSGDKVEECRVVRFHYTCWLEGQDEPFDCSRLRNRVRRVRLNGGGLITGLYYGLLTMNVGELADFIVNFTYSCFESQISFVSFCCIVDH